MISLNADRRKGVFQTATVMITYAVKRRGEFVDSIVEVPKKKVLICDNGAEAAVRCLHVYLLKAQLDPATGVYRGTYATGVGVGIHRKSNYWQGAIARIFVDGRQLTGAELVELEHKARRTRIARKAQSLERLRRLDKALSEIRP